MALTRSELKLLIKECLVEILSEGLGNVQASASRPPAPGRAPIAGSIREARTPGSGGGRKKPDFDPRLDTPVGGRTPTAALKESIRVNAGNNPVMADILADTARNTLPNMVAGDRQLGQVSEAAASGGPGLQQVEQINGTPEQVFGEETAGRWADLAFMPSKKSA
jgi:hypothetical protein